MVRSLSVPLAVKAMVPAPAEMFCEAVMLPLLVIETLPLVVVMPLMLLTEPMVKSEPEVLLRVKTLVLPDKLAATVATLLLLLKRTSPEAVTARPEVVMVVAPDWVTLPVTSAMRLPPIVVLAKMRLVLLVMLTSCAPELERATAPVKVLA